MNASDAPVVTVGGPQTIVATRQLGSPTFAAAVHSLQATTAGHFLTVPLIRPHSMMHCPAESTLTSSTSPYRVMSDRLTDEYPVQRVSTYELSQQQQQQQQQQQRGYAQKRRRSTYTTDSPPWDLISSTATQSTSLNEFTTNLLGSSSTLAPSFLRRHHPHHQHSFPPLSFSYRTGATSGVAPSLLLPPWSARSALGQVAGCLGAVPPPPYPCSVQRGDAHPSPRTVDVCHEPKTERHHQQHPARRLSVCAADKLSSLTVVTHQYTPSDVLTYNSGGSGADANRHQLTEGTASSYRYYN